ncbi:hypothetical protein VZT92_024922 [Zoarces viviparus]|uniref:Uncharacterized protein n=1 Tax=Zoarces viviparus TaxID=48416 RepID=A0AAW1E306_ZOAVI
MGQKTRLHQQHKGQKAGIFDLGTKMAQMNGTRIPGLTVQSDINRRGAHESDAQVFYPHIIHILAKLNKQPVPHAECHLSHLYIIAIFNFACSLSSSPSHNGKLRYLKEEHEQLLNSSMVCCTQSPG